MSEKEKLLFTSNFSFSRNVFHSSIILVRQNVVLCGNGLKNMQMTNVSDRYAFERVEKKKLEKEGMVVIINFLFSHIVF